MLKRFFHVLIMVRIFTDLIDLIQNILQFRWVLLCHLMELFVYSFSVFYRVHLTQSEMFSRILDFDGLFFLPFLHLLDIFRPQLRFQMFLFVFIDDIFNHFGFVLKSIFSLDDVDNPIFMFVYFDYSLDHGYQPLYFITFYN